MGLPVGDDSCRLTLACKCTSMDLVPSIVESEFGCMVGTSCVNLIPYSYQSNLHGILSRFRVRWTGQIFLLLCSDQGQKLRTRRLSAPPNRKQKPWPAGIWHHLPVRDPPPQIYNRGSLFGAMRGGASHYTVHPEWPDYQNSTFNSDVVH